MSGAKKTLDQPLTITHEMVILNKLGLHARPASMFVKTANRFACEVHVERTVKRSTARALWA